ncbi:MAG TPA: zinc ribbon domain-containing protein [Myxococcaceae bacterium]|nr:zinc ribbon domain-containing protein [Myxococcaceae bacterium]
MPIYEYDCSQCHKTSDTLQKVNDPPPETCPHCGARNTLSRLLSRTSFVLKGGGWYADLYSSSKPKSEGGESKPPATSEGSSSTSSGASTSGSSGTGTNGGGGTGSSSGGSSSTSGSSGSSGPVNSAPKVAAAKA